MARGKIGRPSKEIQALGYLRVGTGKLDDRTILATRGLGMQAVDRGGGLQALWRRNTVRAMYHKRVPWPPLGPVGYDPVQPFEVAAHRSHARRDRLSGKHDTRCGGSPLRGRPVAVRGVSLVHGTHCLQPVAALNVDVGRQPQPWDECNSIRIKRQLARLPSWANLRGRAASEQPYRNGGPRSLSWRRQSGALSPRYRPCIFCLDFAKALSSSRSLGTMGRSSRRAFSGSSERSSALRLRLSSLR